MTTQPRRPASSAVHRPMAWAGCRLKTESDWVKGLQTGFKDDGYRFPALLRRIATSPEFYRVATAADGRHRHAVETRGR